MAEPQNSSPASGAGGGARSAEESGNQSRGIMGRVRERAAEQLTSQKDRATDGLGTVADAVRQTTERLRSEHHETVAGYVEQAADQIERFSQRLRQKDVGEILEDAQNLARRQPAVFIGSAFALGLVGARFMKSSNPDRERSEQYGGEGRFGSDEYRSRSYGGSYTGGAGSSVYGAGAGAGYSGATSGGSSSGATGSGLSGGRSTSTSSASTGTRGGRRSSSQPGGTSGSATPNDWRKDAE